MNWDAGFQVTAREKFLHLTAKEKFLAHITLALPSAFEIREPLLRDELESAFVAYSDAVANAMSFPTVSVLERSFHSAQLTEIEKDIIQAAFLVYGVFGWRDDMDDNEIVSRHEPHSDAMLDEYFAYADWLAVEPPSFPPEGDDLLGKLRWERFEAAVAKVPSWLADSTVARAVLKRARRKIRAAEESFLRKWAYHRIDDALGTADTVWLDDAICFVLSHFSQRERQVIALRFGLADGRYRTWKEVGSEFNRTRSWADQVGARALVRLAGPMLSTLLGAFVRDIPPS